LTQTITKITFGHLGGLLHTSLFMAWLHLVCNHEKPSFEIPSDCLVGYYVRPVIYSAAGWTIYKAYKAMTILRDKRPEHYRFAAVQSINSSVAKSIGIPTSLVKRRQRGSLMYCTQQYFDFICFVESVYLANLSLEMMVA
jgi:hypothetical protein